jgi:hypothetical protein
LGGRAALVAQRPLLLHSSARTRRLVVEANASLQIIACLFTLANNMDLSALLQYRVATGQ